MKAQDKKMTFSFVEFFAAILLAVFVSCATKPKVEDESQLVIEKGDASVITLVETTTKTETTTYNFEGMQGNVQWISCSSVPAAKRTVLVFHGMDAGYDPASFCKGWIGQVFASNGYNVLAINRPGYGLSTGGNDLSGPKSIEAIQAGVNQAKMPSIEGVWAYDTGTIAAAFYAKKTGSSLKWMLLGGGIYDLEVVNKTTIHLGLKKQIETLKSEERDLVFERRSISWDFAGIPKLIGLYHAKGDQFAPIGQAESFNDQLRTAEYKVFKNDIAEEGHAIPWRAHAQIVGQVLVQIAPEEQKTSKSP